MAEWSELSGRSFRVYGPPLNVGGVRLALAQAATEYVGRYAVPESRLTRLGLCSCLIHANRIGIPGTPTLDTG